jgi:ammonium transporter, Amt family
VKSPLPWLTILFLLAGVLPLTAADSAPATVESVAAVQRNVNYIWALLSSVLVVFMKTGFAMLELGCTRSKNAINILMKNFLDFCAVALVFLFIGYPLMFGDSFQGLFGNSGFDLWKGSGKEPVWIFWLFQLGFASVTATIVSGAIAERTKFLAYVIFSAVFALCIYPIYGHWAWGGGAHAFLDGATLPTQMGWLQRLGFKDFAGGSVVHEVGGACALAAIIVVGPRCGRFDEKGQPNLIPGHSMPFAALGTFILWIGWYGFNAGSTLLAGAEIGRIAVNTTMAPCLGALAAMISMWKIQGRPDLSISLNGALAGLVAITPACANVNVGSSLLIGAVAGLLTTYATILMEKLRLDDAVGAVPVHLVNGFWGILATELFDESGFQVNEFMVQLTGAVVAPVFAFVMAFLVFKILAATIGVRATDTEQDEGLDFHEHAANAYPDFHASEHS